MTDPQSFNRYSYVLTDPVNFPCPDDRFVRLISLLTKGSKVS